MKIVGCDLHTRYQQIAMLHTETARRWCPTHSRVSNEFTWACGPPMGMKIWDRNDFRMSGTGYH